MWMESADTTAARLMITAAAAARSVFGSSLEDELTEARADC